MSIKQRGYGTLRHNKWLTNISVIAIIASTIILNVIVMPSILSIISKRNIGMTHKIDGLELQALLKGPEVPQLVFINIKDEQDAMRMAKQYERMFFGGDPGGAAVTVSRDAVRDTWNVHLEPQNKTSTLYDSGGVYTMQSDGMLVGFSIVAWDKKQIANLDDERTQRQAYQAADDIIIKMGYSNSCSWGYDQNNIIAYRLTGSTQQSMYLTFFMHEDKLYLLCMKNGWTGVNQ